MVFVCDGGAVMPGQLGLWLLMLLFAIIIFGSYVQSELLLSQYELVRRYADSLAG
jgi:hypothetical protein